MCQSCLYTVFAVSWGPSTRCDSALGTREALSTRVNRRVLSRITILAARSGLFLHDLRKKQSVMLTASTEEGRDGWSRKYDHSFIIL